MADRRWTTADFDYRLPEHLIAQVPPEERGRSRLLVVDPAADALRDAEFAAVVTMVPPGDLLVLNATRVRHARLLGSRPSGGPAEVLLVHPLGDDGWLAMGKPGKALQPGRRIALGDGIEIETTAVREDGFREVRFCGADAATAIARHGHLPLPPYITREADANDEQRYQTVYAEREGSVAAPTAGLHFTERHLGTLRDRGVEVTSLDLEVGPGTFRPVETDDPRAHEMHAERFEIPEAAALAIAAARARGGRIWAVGTTVVRALESAATAGGSVGAGTAETRLMILPGHRFRVVDRLLTNFHLPRSTLLMLVAAFAGHDLTMRAYRHAVDARYRFYSYGDAMCIVTRPQ
jgi:S-adenosylmethionine:tRNA ribosyltransferase-isomerase